MNRHPAPSAKDRKIFGKTAASTKAINVKPSIRRGGTRL